MSEWKEGRPDKVDDYISDLNKLKDTIHQTISDLKDKKKELLLKMEEEKEKAMKRREAFSKAKKRKNKRRKNRRSKKGKVFGKFK